MEQPAQNITSKCISIQQMRLRRSFELRSDRQIVTPVGSDHEGENALSGLLRTSPQDRRRMPAYARMGADEMVGAVLSFDRPQPFCNLFHGR